MSEFISPTFDPDRLRRLALGNEAFIRALPEGFPELFEIVRFGNEQGGELGDGLRALNKVATDFLYSGPKALEDAIAYSWSSARGLRAPYQPDELHLVGDTERPKKVAEYTEQEAAEWERFLDGLDPTDSPITRGTAVAGLSRLRFVMNSRIQTVGKYGLSPGENSLVFSRVKDILVGTPFVIATSMLPDMTADEACTIFPILPDQYPEVVNEFAERAQGPIFEAPGL